MIIHDVIQGTSQWLSLRAGIPTASAFDKILTPGGKPSKSAEAYLYTLLAERLMGHPTIDHVSMWQERGKQLEIDAVSFYELQRNCDTIVVGFVTDDGKRVGASPDRLCGEDGQLEIKVPKESTHMGYLLQSGSAYEAYKVQCQGQLWITGRKWVDVLSWHPELPPALIRIDRDEAFIALLAAAVTTFSLELERMTEELKAKGWMAEKLATTGAVVEVKPGVYEPTPQAKRDTRKWTSEDSVRLLKEIEAAASIQNLQLCGEQAKDKRISEADRELMRGVYAARLKQLKAAEPQT